MTVLVYTKVCRTCRREFGLEHYSKAKTNRDGYRHDCRACVSDYAKAKGNIYKIRRKFRDAGIDPDLAYPLPGHSKRKQDPEYWHRVWIRESESSGI